MKKGVFHLKNKNFLSLIVLILLSLVLTACGGSSESAAGEVTIPEDPNEVEGEITVWAWNLEAAFLQDDIKPKFEEKYPNVEVTVEQLSADQVYEKLNAGLSGGGSGLPDVLQIENKKIQSFTQQFPDAFVNLEDLGFDQYADAFPESKVEGLKDESGNIVAAPRDLGPVGVFYRVDVFEEVGIDPATIKTWNDYIEAGKKIVAETDMSLLGTESDAILRVMLQQQDSYYFTDDGKIDINSEEAQRAMATLKEMVDADLIEYTTDWDGQVSAMKNGKVATHPGAVWWSGTMIGQMPELEGKWGMFKLPVFEEGGVSAANDGGSALSIPQSSDNKAAAYLFAEMASVEVDSQMTALKDHGLFPALLAAYEEPFFSQNQEYYNNQPIFQEFADTVENIPAINFTTDNLVVSDMMISNIEALLLEGADPMKLLEDAEEQVASRTGREVAE